MKIAIIIPAYNEASIIAKVLNGLKKLGTSYKLVVIDDGSKDKTAQLASKAGAIVITHPINRGLGASIKTGLEWAKTNNIDVAVTFDGDGQHNPKDVKKILNPIIKKNADVAIGSRFKNRQKMPFDRFIINWFANLATFILYGALSTDSQSGLRAFSKKAINCINLTAERMDISSEIILETKSKKLKYSEVPIKAIYTAYSREKGQKNSNALPVFGKFVFKLLR